MTLALDPTDALVDACRVHRNRTAIVDGSTTLTFGELGRRIDSVAAGLKAQGFAAGDKVLFSVRPGVDALIAIAAIMRAGGMLIFADPGMGRELFMQRLATVEPQWAIAESLLYTASTRVARPFMKRRGLQLPDVGKLDVRHIRVGPRFPGVPKSISFRRLNNTPPQSMVTATDADALIVFTSGTTEMPRAVIHSRPGLHHSMAELATLLDIRPGASLYTDELHTVLPALMRGGAVVFPKRYATPRERLDEIRRVNATHLFCIPPDMQALIDAAKTADVDFPPSVRWVAMGSAPIGANLLRALKDVAPSLTVWCVYAMTEMLPVCAVSGDEKLAFSGAGDMVGHPIAGTKVTIASSGEVLVEGPHLSKGIVGAKPHTVHHTGDLGYLDSEGRLVLTGRAKQMIIRGHYNVYPGLYEPGIMAIPDVRACAMVGVPTDNDERIVLLVEGDESASPTDLTTRVERALRNGTVPIDDWAHPDMVAVAQIPRSGRSSKIDRAEASALAAQLLDSK